MTPNDRIIIEAQDATNAKERQLKESPIRDYDRMVSELYGYNKGYIAGATAEHDRAQVLVDALKEFISYHETGLLPARHVYEKGVKALEQWEGKEVKPEHNVSIGEHITYCQDCGFPLLPIDECNCDDL